MKRIKLYFEANSTGINLHYDSNLINHPDIFQNLIKIDGIVNYQIINKYCLYLNKGLLFKFDIDIIPQILNIIIKSLPNEYFEIVNNSNFNIDSSLFERTILSNEI